MEIRVKIIPRERDEGVAKLADGRYRVSVKADRKEGRANERMRELLAEHFGVPLRAIVLVSGHTSPTKTVRVFDRAEEVL